jgi:hypothetical protein
MDVIDGLTIIVPGSELLALLQRRIDDHQTEAEWWTKEQQRMIGDQTDEAPLLPERLCEREAQRHEWRVRILTFVKDHLAVSSPYRLSEADVEALLPGKPAWMEDGHPSSGLCL